MKADALIGHTGFVGRTLSSQHIFSDHFNSRNIADAAGEVFSSVVCAAAPGSMFEANRHPDQDRDNIDRLITQLESFSADRFILISTIAVLQNFTASDEFSAEFEENTPYGANRRRLELFVSDHFQDHLIIRLPALFGQGLKKNFLFDLVNPVPSMLTAEKLDSLRDEVGESLGALVDDIYTWDDRLSLKCVDREGLDASGRREELEAAVVEHGFSALQFTNPQSKFQFYDMRNLWADIQLGLDADLRTLHLAPPPMTAGDIFAALQYGVMADNSARVHSEDMRTAHASLWNRTGPYRSDKEDVVAGIASFMKEAVAA